jgi:hypothetical protein
MAGPAAKVPVRGHEIEYNIREQSWKNWGGHVVQTTKNEKCIHNISWKSLYLDLDRRIILKYVLIWIGFVYLRRGASYGLLRTMQ